LTTKSRDNLFLLLFISVVLIFLNISVVKKITADQYKTMNKIRVWSLILVQEIIHLLLNIEEKAKIIKTLPVCEIKIQEKVAPKMINKNLPFVINTLKIKIGIIFCQVINKITWVFIKNLIISVNHRWKGGEAIFTIKDVKIIMLIKFTKSLGVAYSTVLKIIAEDILWIIKYFNLLLILSFNLSIGKNLLIETNDIVFISNILQIINQDLLKILISGVNKTIVKGITKIKITFLLKLQVSSHESHL